MISFKVAAKLVQKLEFLRILQRYTKKWITSFILWGFRFHLMMFFKIYSNWCRKPYPTWICNQKKQLFSADMTATNTTKIKAWRRWVGHVERGLDDDRCLRCQLCGDRHDFSCTEDVEENMYRIECWNEYIYIYLVTKIFLTLYCMYHLFVRDDMFLLLQLNYMWLHTVYIQRSSLVPCSTRFYITMGIFHPHLSISADKSEEPLFRVSKADVGGLKVSE